MKITKSESIGEFEELCANNPHINEPTENREERDFFVLNDNGFRIGCGYIRSFFQKIGTIGSIFVKKKWRRKGFGSYLVEKLEDEHKGNGVWIVLIGVHNGNEIGFDFWEEKGYEVLIDSINKPLVKNPIDLGILDKISPVPVPNKEVSILGKPLKELNFETGREIVDESGNFFERLENFFHNRL